MTLEEGVRVCAVLRDKPQEIHQKQALVTFLSGEANRYNGVECWFQHMAVRVLVVDPATPGTHSGFGVVVRWYLPRAGVGGVQARRIAFQLSHIWTNLFAASS
jgi:hypothetical protein